MWVPLPDLANMTPFQMKVTELVVYLTVMLPSYFKLFQKDPHYSINKDQKLSVYSLIYFRLTIFIFRHHNNNSVG